MIYYLLLSLVLLYVTYKFLKIRNLPPGPWGLPIVGYLPWLNAEAPYLTLTELSKKYGDIYGLQLGNVYTVVLTNPKMIKTLFSKESTTGRAPLYMTHGIMEGYGLICAEGDLWKDQRKFIHNSLKQLGASRTTGTVRNSMETLIEEHISEFLKSIEDVLNTPIDPLPFLQHSLGSIINCIVFGKCWSKDDETWKWLQHLQEEGTKYIGIAGPLNFLPFMRFLSKYKSTMQFLMNGKIETHKFYQKLIEEQMEQIETFGENDTATNIIQAFLLERKKRKDDSLEKFYNQKQFYHLLSDIFGASLDTTLTTLRWYLLFLAKHPDIQQSIRTELQEILHNRPLSMNDMSQLPLLQASIYESQRIRSVVPVGMPHGAIEDFVVDGFRIPKDTMLIPLQWAIHMNESVWNEPEIFNPNRFLDEDGKIKKVEYFMPFQIGKRMCVGEELAKMLLFFFGASIIQTFSISMENDTCDLIGECGITLTPKPHKLIFKKV